MGTFYVPVCMLSQHVGPVRAVKQGCSVDYDLLVAPWPVQSRAQSLIFLNMSVFFKKISLAQSHQEFIFLRNHPTYHIASQESKRSESELPTSKAY